MPQPVRARGRSDEPWERGFYLLLLVVAVVVILYSLFGIATLLGYLPLSQSGGSQTHHPAVEAQRPLDRIQDRASAGNAKAAPCSRRVGVKVAALTPSMGGSAFEPLGAPCAEVETDRRAARNAMAPVLSNMRASSEGTSK